MTTPKSTPTPTESSWQNTLDRVKEHVFSIATPSGSGTGFLVARSSDQKVIGVATAFHVIQDSYEWNQPVRLTHFASGKSVLLTERSRSIHVKERQDSALIRLKRGKFRLPKTTLERINEGYHKRAAVEIGWCGFPAVSPRELCFFSGRISAYLDEEDAYLVDGVAINGVSGGPVFDLWGTAFGLVTAYIPNRQRGEPLPGVSLVRSLHPLVEFFQEVTGAPTESSADTSITEPPKLEPPPGMTEPPVEKPTKQGRS